MAVSFRAASAVVFDASTTSISPSKPAGTVEGDVMLAFVKRVSNAADPTSTPSGWSLVRKDDSSGFVTMWVYTKVATASEPSSYSWSWAASGFTEAAILSYEGATGLGADDGDVGSSTSATAPSVTAPGGGARLVFGVAGRVGTSTTTPSGMTSRAAGAGTTYRVCDEAVNQGSTGSRTSTLGASTQWAAVAVVVAPDNVVGIPVVGGVANFVGGTGGFVL